MVAPKETILSVTERYDEKFEKVHTLASLTYTMIGALASNPRYDHPLVFTSVRFSLRGHFILFDKSNVIVA